MRFFTNRLNNIFSSVTPPGGGNTPPPQGPQNNPSAPDPSGGGGRFQWVKPYISGVGSQLAVDKAVEIAQASGLQERKLSHSNKQHTKQLSLHLQDRLYDDKIGLITYTKNKLSLGQSKESIKTELIDYLQFKEQTNSLPPAYRDLYEMKADFDIETIKHEKEVVEVFFRPKVERTNTTQGPRKSPPFASIMNQPSIFPELQSVDANITCAQIRRQEQLEIVGFWGMRILGLVLLLLFINRIMCGYWIAPKNEMIDEYNQWKNNTFSAGVPTTTDKSKYKGAKGKSVRSTARLRRLSRKRKKLRSKEMPNSDQAN